MENILSLRFGDSKQFENAKYWFRNESIYDPCGISDEWMTFEFECTCGVDVDNLELDMERELVMDAGLDNFYFESN